MTLHLSVMAGNVVLQVGDRLLSKGDRDWDPYANKNILILARDATVVVSYTGVAHMRRATNPRWMQTDEWLAGAITGGTHSDQDFAYATRFGGDLNVRLSHVVRSVKAAIVEDLLEMPARFRKVGLEVLITGWNWKLRNDQRGSIARPFSLTIKHTGIRGASLFVEANPVPSRPDEVAAICIGAMERQAFLDWTARLQQMDLSATSVEKMEMALVEEIRAASRRFRGRYVGSECMSIWIAASQEVRVRFIRDVALKRPRHSFTPWVIGSGMIQRPSILEGEGSTGIVEVDSEENVVRQIPYECIPPFPTVPDSTDGDGYRMRMSQRRAPRRGP